MTASLNREATAEPLRARVPTASYAWVKVALSSRTVLGERPNCPNACSHPYAISPCAIPPAYSSTLHRLRTALGLAPLLHSWEREGAARPRLCGPCTPSTPAAVLNVPAAEPVR